MTEIIAKNWRSILIVSLTSALYALTSVVSAAYYGYIVERSHHKDTTLFFMMIVAGITVVLLRYVFDVINQTLMVKFVGKIMYGIREKPWLASRLTKCLNLVRIKSVLIRLIYSTMSN